MHMTFLLWNVRSSNNLHIITALKYNPIFDKNVHVASIIIVIIKRDRNSCIIYQNRYIETPFFCKSE